MNWDARISTARKAGGFTEEDEEFALGWPTCACGACEVPRNPVGSPADRPMYLLGLRFFKAVSRHEFDEASEVLGLIERRAAEVLA